MAKQIHYLLIATHLPSDSEVLFFKTVDEAKAEFKKRTQELFAVDGLEEDNDYWMEDEWAVRFNSGNNEELGAILEEVDHYFKVGTQDVEDDCDFYVTDFSEYVDESRITFFNRENAVIAYNDLVESALAIEGDVNRYDQTTWEDESGVTLFSETDNDDGSTDAFFGMNDVYWTYRIGKVTLTK
jgi:hypothetical protein